ncbi:flagellar biosynthesis protein FlhF [Paenibacillus crassostreae]|uniref:Flagellar biosynthesis protein FlhF n=1 Tax=Paenibacillus crassostreae TaxID=1763538 RepID=A0A167FMZ8_9BACL|nr:flagellar biosynthesis protein FlhF [Paenibacillus crassostreae]AOZ94238.1 flagellar biosynthesis protein FlhF [Paenibacillus crassostreae]OAB76726.1 flagellar biosynthesis protein FlhF [Paenibacillus crassostreae]
MRVKRYIVDHMPEAMQKIRLDLGSDAVILSTKETKVGGFLGMFKKKKIEVVAAVEKDALTKSVRQTNSNLVMTSNDLMKVENKVRESVQNYSPPLNVPEKAVPEAYKRTNEVLRTAMKDANPQGNSDSLESRVMNESAKEKLKDMEELVPQKNRNYIVEEKKNSTGNSEERLLKEIREMKSWMAKMSRQSMMRQQLPETIQKMQDQLQQQEIEESLREEWINAAFDYWDESGRTLSDDELQQFVRGKVRDFLSNRLSDGIGSNTKIVYVAGPTGVGKTTTIAKLAAEQIFRNHRKVGFITSDTYRISAVEQLRTYASILNVPLEVVQSPADFQRALKRLDYCDLILMDTAGRNYRNELLVSELQSLLSYDDNTETYLVLSLTSKTQDMLKITEHFSKYGLDKVIFTKLDETGSYGAIFNLIYNYPIHLSYLTNGQNVPDDLIRPNIEVLCDLLLGLGVDEL